MTSELTAIQDFIKSRLKREKLTYKVVASDINVSERTLKRLLNGPDISISQLTQLCSFLGVELRDLLSQALSASATVFRLTEDQEVLLAKYPGYFGLYKLLQRGLSPHTIRKQYGIPEVAINRALKSLEKAKLVIRDINGGAKPAQNGNFSWILGGPLQRKYVLKTEVDFIEKNINHVVATGRLVNGSYFNSSAYLMQPINWEIFKTEVAKLVKEFHAKAILDAKNTAAGDLVPTKWLICMAQEPPLEEILVRELK